MKIEELEKIIAAYYDGRTTEEEEKLLRNYFKKQDVPGRFLLDKKLFLSLRSPYHEEIPADMENKLTRLIDAKAEEEKRFLSRNKTRRNWKWIGGIAASILLMLTISYSILSLHNNQPKDTFSDPNDAYEVLHALFLEMSDTMNKGIDQLAESRQEVNKINKEIKEEIYN